MRLGSVYLLRLRESSAAFWVLSAGGTCELACLGRFFEFGAGARQVSAGRRAGDGVLCFVGSGDSHFLEKALIKHSLSRLVFPSFAPSFTSVFVLMLC